MKLVLASGNAGKLAEFRTLLGDAGWEVLPQSHWGITDAEETGGTFIENALIKARHAARASGLPALADDSGLCVDALEGAPGIHSARYTGTHGDSHANIDKLLAALRAVEPARRTARFVCVLALLRHAADPLPLIAQGTWEGHILPAPRGIHGFGYDPVFQPVDHPHSAAELAPDLKHRISHRARAMLRLRDLLQAQ